MIINPTRALYQRSAEVPPRRGALSVCPCGDPWGTPVESEITYSRPPVKPPMGQTRRSPRLNVNSVLTQAYSPTVHS